MTAFLRTLSLNLAARWLAPPGRYHWTTRDRRSLFVDEMTDEHLLNALRLADERLVRWAALRNEARIRRLKPKEIRRVFMPVTGGNDREHGPWTLEFLDDENEHF